MIQTENISFHYSNSKELSFANMLFERGKMYGIIGESGCGKSTLLQLLCGIIKPINGNVSFDNQSLNLFSQSDLDALRGNKFGIVFQKNHLLLSLSVIENVLLPYFLNKKKEDIAYAKELLNEVGLADKSNKKTGELSLGEQQRVAIARALILRPDYILADEPTSSLDDKNCDSIMQLLITSSKANNSGLIAVTHDNRIKKHFENIIEL